MDGNEGLTTLAFERGVYGSGARLSETKKEGRPLTPFYETA